MLTQTERDQWVERGVRAAKDPFRPYTRREAESYADATRGALDNGEEAATLFLAGYYGAKGDLV